MQTRGQHGRTADVRNGEGDRVDVATGCPDNAEDPRRAGDDRAVAVPRAFWCRGRPRRIVDPAWVLGAARWRRQRLRITGGQPKPPDDRRVVVDHHHRHRALIGELMGECGVVEVAPQSRDDEDLGRELCCHKTDLALAPDRQHRVLHRPKTRQCHHDHHGLQRARQLPRHHRACAHALLRQARRRMSARRDAIVRSTACDHSHR